jgi:hypothetical protein
LHHMVGDVWYTVSPPSRLDTHSERQPLEGDT